MGQESLIRWDRRRRLDRTGEVIYGSGEFDRMEQEKISANCVNYLQGLKILYKIISCTAASYEIGKTNLYPTVASYNLEL